MPAPAVIATVMVLPSVEPFQRVELLVISQRLLHVDVP